MVWECNHQQHIRQVSVWRTTLSSHVPLNMNSCIVTGGKRNLSFTKFSRNTKYCIKLFFHWRFPWLCQAFRMLLIGSFHFNVLGSVSIQANLFCKPGGRSAAAAWLLLSFSSLLSTAFACCVPSELLWLRGFSTDNKRKKNEKFAFLVSRKRVLLKYLLLNINRVLRSGSTLHVDQNYLNRITLLISFCCNHLNLDGWQRRQPFPLPKLMMGFN